MNASHAALMAEADEAARHAYAPYSSFQVGAALLSTDGRIFRGCNVENSSYGLCNCAERTAVFAAVAAGAREFAAIAVTQGGDKPSTEPCWPCGACRQVLAEFNPAMTVVLHSGDSLLALPLKELLPHSFDAHRLKV